MKFTTAVIIGGFSIMFSFSAQANKGPLRGTCCCMTLNAPQYSDVDNNFKTLTGSYKVRWVIVTPDYPLEDQL